MTETKDQLWKAEPGAQASEPLEDLVSAGAHPVGLDVGTSKVVSARRGGSRSSSSGRCGRGSSPWRSRRSG